MTDHKIATREEWQAARDELLAREKDLTRRGDLLAAERRALPWVPIKKEYKFDTDEGPKTLRDLFDGRSQLIVYHFMFGPAYTAGCPLCSSGADSFNRALPHLNARDVTFTYAYALEDHTVYLTSSTTARGLESMIGYYGFLDRAPLGRNEGNPPELWIRRHDEYHNTNTTSQ